MRQAKSGLPETREQIVARVTKLLASRYPIAAPAMTLLDLPRPEREVWLGSFTEDEQRELEHSWDFWARPKQRFPAGNWKRWILTCGRGFGKTRTGAEWVRDKIETGAYRHIALVAANAKDLRRVIVEDVRGGGSGLLQICPPWNMPDYSPTKMRLTWNNPNYPSYGASCSLYSAEEPDSLRGPAHDGAWCVAAGTRIETANGSKPVECIRSGEFIHTRKGLRLCAAAVLTRRNAQIYRLTTTTGGELKMTAEHPVWVSGKGWVRCDKLRVGDILCTWNSTSTLVPQFGLDGEEYAGTEIKKMDITGIEPGHCFTYASGNANISSPFPSDKLSTIKTKSSTIISRRILSACQGENTPNITLNTDLQTTSGICVPSEQKPQQQKCGQIENLRSVSVRSATATTKVSVHTPITAAPFAETGIAVESVELLSQPADVYDLTIEDAHEFFANGILTHNCDELAKWPRAQEVWDQLQFGLRTGTTPQVVVTTTPSASCLLFLKLWKEAIAQANPNSEDYIPDPLQRETIFTTGSTFENEANLSSSFLQDVLNEYEGTRLGQQELYAAVLTDIEGALWNTKLIEQAYLVRNAALPPIRTRVVGVDPQMSFVPGALTGIVVAGMSPPFNGSPTQGYVFDDRSMSGSPKEWAKAVVDAYQDYDCSWVVAERNQGGDLVKDNIHNVNPNVRVKLITATKSKGERAIPVVGRYEQGRVFHVGRFTKLEEEMLTFVPGDEKKKRSPNRVDALVHALDFLLVGGMRAGAGIAISKRI